MYMNKLTCVTQYGRQRAHIWRHRSASFPSTVVFPGQKHAPSCLQAACETRRKQTPRYRGASFRILTFPNGARMYRQPGSARLGLGGGVSVSMVKCVVSGCPNRVVTVNANNRGVHDRPPKRFFNFPTDPARVKVSCGEMSGPQTQTGSCRCR